MNCRTRIKNICRDKDCKSKYKIYIFLFYSSLRFLFFFEISACKSNHLIFGNILNFRQIHIKIHNVVISIPIIVYINFNRELTG